MSKVAMPHVRGFVAQMNPKSGERHDWDGFWAYKVELYIPDIEDGEGERLVYCFHSTDLMPPAVFYTRVEVDRALQAKVNEVMMMLNRGGSNDGFVLDTKTGEIKRIGRKASR